MEINQLIINLGSSSKKYSLYQNDTLRYVAHFESHGEKFRINEEGVGESDIDAKIYKNALLTVLKRGKELSGIEQENIHAIGIRVVAPGDFFTTHRRIDDAYIEGLRRISAEVALHADLVLEEIATLRKVVPQIQLYGISDSAYHRTIPNHARVYGLPTALAEKYDLHRFGYHGLSAASVIRATSQLMPTLPHRIIICHLGSGVSITAVKDGMSVDTSMGFSPLEGPIMSSRVGSIDAGAILTVLEGEKITPAQLRTKLYTESGLLGVSGESEDMRVLLEKEAQGSAPARDAIALFVYRIQLLIGGYATALGGLDLLIFTGTMGERSDVIRARICAGLKSIGVTVDATRNAAPAGQSGSIHEMGSPIQVAIVHANESAQMKQELSLLMRR